MADSSVNLNLNNTNIRQITSYDMENPGTKASRISIDTNPTPIDVYGATEEATRTIDVIYAELNVEEAQKLGYCCDESVRKIPVFIKFNNTNEERTFYIGRTGMLEIQPETWKNINGDNYNDLNGRVYSVKIEYIKVPYKYKIDDDYIVNNFQVDYLTNSSGVNNSSE